MRDMNRIYEFCNELSKIWAEKCPDMRFGQMISNVQYALNGKDIFFIEEPEMLKIIKDYFGYEEE